MTPHLYENKVDVLDLVGRVVCSVEISLPNHATHDESEIISRDTRDMISV